MSASAERRTLRLGVLALAAAAVSGLALGSGAFASARPDPWQSAAARVTFPIYRPSVTLGLALGPVVVERCGNSGNTWIRASYAKGTGDRQALFGFDESYPRHCGDAGERVTVGSADVNGADVPVEVYCSSADPKCTIADGFANGFHLELRGPGPKPTMIGVYSRRIALPDLLRMVRSLETVPKSRIVSPTAPAAAGLCSKTTALAVAERFRMAAPDAGDSVARVLCGAFTGPGSRAIAVAITPGTCGINGWAVFELTGGAWRLVGSRQPGWVMDIAAVGSAIRETAPVPTGEFRCPTSGKVRARIWRWNGSRLVAGPWTQESPGTGTSPAAGQARGYFKTPSGNIVCYQTKTFVVCGIKSGLEPKPPYTSACKAARLDHNADRIGLGATGPAEPVACSGDAGPFVGEGSARVLGYGQTRSNGGIRCTSATAGLTCRNESGRGFFLSRERWRSF